jgi:hypothetical protein
MFYSTAVLPALGSASFALSHESKGLMMNAFIVLSRKWKKAHTSGRFFLSRPRSQPGSRKHIS